MRLNKLFIVTLVSTLSAGVWAEILLWDNGPFITHPFGGAGGAHASAIQSPGTTFGWNINHAHASNFRIADDVVLPGGLPLTKLFWYGYQTGSGTTSTFTGAYVRIWSGEPGAGGSIIAGDGTTNRMITSRWTPNFYGTTGIYRVTETTLSSTARPVMEIEIDMSWVPVLPAGTYWIDVGLTGTLASGPWANPTVPNTGATGAPNAKQHGAGTWTTLVDTGGGFSVEMPYKLYAVPEPATLLALATGLSLIALRRRKR